MKFSINRILSLVIILAVLGVGITIFIYTARTKQGNTFVDTGHNFSLLNIILSFILIAVSVISIIILRQIELANKQQQLQEQKFSALLEAAPDATIIVNEAGIIQMVNKQTGNLFGYTPAEIIGQPVEILIPAELRNKHHHHRANFVKAARVRTIGAGLELNAVKKNETVFPVEISLSPIQTDDGLLVSASVRDISNRKSEEEKLRKSETNFQLLVSSVKDYAIFLLDITGKVASWNAGAEIIKGYRAEEIIGKPMHIFYTAEAIEKGEPKNNLKMARENGHYETEGWRLRKNGSSFYANVVFTSLFDKEGNLYGYAKVTKDITEKRKAEDRIRFLATIADNIQDPVITSDNNFCTTRWNAAAEKLFEWKSEEVIGKTIREVLQIIYPYHTREQILESFNEKGYWQGEVIYHTKSGKPLNILATASHLKDVNENITGILVLAKDITDRIKAEKQLKEFEYFFNNSNDFSCIANTEGYFEINPSFTKVLGYSENELSKNPFIDFVHPDDIATTLEAYGQLKAGATLIHFINRYRKKDGNYLWLDWNATPNATTGKLYCIARDITERKKAEDALSKLNEELEQRVKERTEAIQRSEERYHHLFDNNPMPMWVIDLSTFKFLDVNEMAILQYGYSRKEFLSMTAIDIRPDGDKDYFINSDHSFKPNEGSYNKGVWRHQRKDGTILHVEISAHEILFEGTQAKLILANDVTEQKEAERRLISSETRFRALIENNNDIISLMDKSFKVIYRSPSAARITGWSNEELIGINGINKIHPDDIEMAKGIIQQLMTNPGKTINTLFRNQHKDGHYLWVEGSVTNLLQDEDVKAIVFNFRDVTARIEAKEKLAASEMRFRMLIENSADGIDLSDEFSNNIYRSPGAIKIMGILPKDNQRSLTHPDDLEIIKNKSEELIKKPGIPIHFQARFRHALGHYIWLEGTLTNLLHVEGVHAIITNFRDVTKRKELEDLLHKANTLARIGSWEINLLKGTVYWNDITREIHETESSFVPDLATGINFYKEGPGRDLIAQKVKEAIEFCTPWDVELQIITAKNNERWVRSIGETEFADGKCIRIYGSFQDIDKRKKVEEALLRSEARARRIFESDMIGFIFWSEKGQILEANDYFLNMTGYTRQDLEKGLVNWAAMTPPEYANLDISSLKQIEATGICKPFEKEYIRKDGSRFPIILGAAALGENFEGVGVCYVMDISERKKAEIDRERLNERFQLATQSAQLGLWDWDVKNNKLIWDEAMYRLYNLSESEFATVYDGWASRVHEEDRERVDNDIQLALAGKKEYNPEFRIVWPDSSVHYINASGIIERDHDGNAVRMTGFNWDVTERKTAEEKIKNVNIELEEKVISRTEQLRRTNEELEAFSYSVSHDLRAPLRGIIGFTSILEEDYTSKLDEEAKRITGVIKTNTLKMGHLIDDLLAFSRMGRQELLKAPVDTNTMVQEIIDQLKATSKNPDLQWLIEPLPVVNADIGTMRQVWINLLSNAVKYSSNTKQPQITIGHYAEGGQQVFFVKDNGVGFNNEYRDKLFRVFQRLHSAEEFEGTGVGLALQEKLFSSMAVRYGQKEK